MTGIGKLGLSLMLVAAGMVTSARSEEAGEALYNKHCKMCHAADGSGKKDGAWVGSAKSLKLEKPEVLDILTAEAKAKSDADLAKFYLEGKADGTGKMKPYKDKITEDEAKMLVQYTRHLQKQSK